ncbi:hypothetical protein V8E51_015794 [Hyaloscypha variabilis]
MASGSPLSEDMSSLDAMTNAEDYDTEPNSGGSFEFIEIPTMATASPTSKPSHEVHDPAIDFTLEQLPEIPQASPIYENFDSDAQLAMALFAEERARISAFLDNRSPSGVVHTLELAAQDFPSQDNDELGQVTEEENRAYNSDGYGSPVLHSFIFEAVTEPEPLLVEITLEDLDGGLPFQFLSIEMKLTKEQKPIPFFMKALSLTRPFKQLSKPLYIDMIEINDTAFHATGSSRVVEATSKSQGPVFSTESPAPAAIILETGSLLVAEQTKSEQYAESSSGKPSLEHMVDTPDAHFLANNTPRTIITSSELTNAGTISLPEKDMYDNTSLFHVKITVKEPNTSVTVAQELLELTATLEKNTSAEAKNSVSSPGIPYSQELNRIRRELVVILNGLVIFMVFLLFNIVALLVVYNSLVRGLEQESRL